MANPKRDKALEKEAASLRRAVEEIDRKKARLVHQLEDRDDPDGSVFRAVRERLSELTAEREGKLAKLGALLDQLGRGSDDDEPAVLDDLPIARLDDLIDAPEAVLRCIFDALRLRLVYDGRTGAADCTVTVTDDTLTAVWGAIGALSDAAGAGGPADGLEANGATGAQGRLFPSVVRSRLSAMRTMTLSSWVRRSCSATATPRSGDRGTADDGR